MTDMIPAVESVPARLEREARDMEERFTYHAPSPEGVATHAELSRLFIDLALRVHDLVPQGRERSLVLTKLEEAKFWASAGVARNPHTR